jgi:hypothetical protein
MRRLVHASHALHVAQTPTGPLLFCARCGHYSAHRVDRLGDACTTVAVAASRRLKRGFDPRDRSPIANVRPVFRTSDGWATYLSGVLCIRAGESQVRLVGGPARVSDPPASSLAAAASPGPT